MLRRSRCYVRGPVYEIRDVHHRDRYAALPEQPHEALFPDDTERLNHIFAKQVYGCAPTEIIYRICLRYILGFGDEVSIKQDNIRLCDTLEYAKNGTLEEELKKLFNSN